MKYKPYHIAACVLGTLLTLLLLLTQFGSRGLRNNTNTVPVTLGFESSHSPRALAIDQFLLDIMERGHFSIELRQRLDRVPHTVQIDSFWADTCEVQQLDFERFARWRQSNRETVSEPGALSSSSTGHRIAGLLQSPASGVNYTGASAYCAASGGRLPWAEEWEAMAVGHEGRLYPWGDTFDDSPWPYQSAYRNAAQSCALHPATATPEGVHDLAGNVMEWSQGQRDLPARQRQPGAHGASAVRAHGRALYALSAAWLNIKPQTRSHHLGFRCVYPQSPAATLPWGAMPKAVAIGGGDYTLGVPRDLRLARVALLLPAAQQRKVRDLISQNQARKIAVSRCEVSRNEYRSFLRHPLVRLGLFANEHEPRWQNYTPQNWQQQLQQLELPVSGVNWWGADAFARWAGGRLPQAEEWQLLATGANANLYPWGNEYVANNATSGTQTAPGLHQCGTRRHDRTPSGVHDMAGNVSEWSRSITAEQGNYAAWVQGGNWLLPSQTTARSVFGRPVPLNHRSDSIGFRVVYDSR